LIETQLFSRIKLEELLVDNFEKNLNKNAPNLAAMIENFNQIVLWVSTQILTQETVQKRAEKIEMFIAVTERLSLNASFDSCMAVYFALDSTPIRNLEKSWELVDENDDMIDIFENMTELSNTDLTDVYQETPNCTPYLAPLLSKLSHWRTAQPDEKR
jgi:son of sevenless-like protein